MSEVKKQDTETCGAGCACGSAGSNGRGRMLIGLAILVVAGVLVVRAMVKDNGAATAGAEPAGFAALPSVSMPAPEAAGTNTPSAAVETLKELEGLADLNAVAGDTSGVFIFLPGKGETAASAPLGLLQGAVRTIEPKLSGGKVGIFALKAGSRDYEQIAKQMTVPGVFVMVKGGSMSSTTGDITEAKLMQAWVTASSAAGCGPSAGGCGPAGCK